MSFSEDVEDYFSKVENQIISCGGYTEKEVQDSERLSWELLELLVRRAGADVRAQRLALTRVMANLTGRSITEKSELLVLTDQTREMSLELAVVARARKESETI